MRSQSLEIEWPQSGTWEMIVGVTIIGGKVLRCDFGSPIQLSNPD